MLPPTTLLASSPALPASNTLAPLVAYVTDAGYRVALYALPLDAIPADFFADPDGAWTPDDLARAAGFAVQRGVAVGALRHPFNGHPDGAAVVTLNSEARPHVAIIECPIAYQVVHEVGRAESSAA